MRRLFSGLATGIAAGLLVPSGLLLASPAHAANDEGMSIDHVEPAGADGTLHVLATVPPGASLDEVTVTVGGTEVTADAEPVSDATELVRRTTVIAIDTSNSMRGDRFAAAKVAAGQFLAGIPDDVYVGIVTFDGTVRTALKPTLDRAAAATVVEGLTLSKGTFLYDGVIASAALTGEDGQRHVLLLSDGADTSKTTLQAATADIRATGVHVDAVTLDDTDASAASLQEIVDAGGGELIPADPAALSEAFEAQAEALTAQIQVEASLPEAITKEQALIRITVPVGGDERSAEVFAVIRHEPGTSDAAVGTVNEDESFLSIPRNAMYGGLAAIGLGLLVALGAVFSMGGQPQSVEQRIAAYGTQPAGPAGKRKGESHQAFNLEEMKGAAATMLHRNRGLEARIEARLEGAGSAFKAPEWLLLHGAIALLAAMVGLLIGNGSVLTTLLGLLVGLLLPWWWLGFKRKRRQAAFNSGLADTLQLLAGSLQAGMSLAQGLDSVVEEGNEPIAGEFKRVLIETRLGVPLEVALEGIAQRMQSMDFGWVVMAIRIQREVGGNLAELLNTVAATLRERDYLRRQVKTLSAEGVMSAYILVALPICMLVYLMLVRREYVMPLFDTGFGLMLLAGAVTLLGLGWLMMSRIVKVEV